MSEDKRGPVETNRLPEFYSNVAMLSMSAYDVTITFNLRDTENNVVPQVRVRNSLPHAWIFAKILDRLLKGYIREVGRIPIPKDLLEEMGLTEAYDADMEVCDG
jgi:hypothetical protein